MADNAIRARAGDTVDALIWRERRLGPAAYDAVLTANPGLADHGPVLPIGTVVLLPVIAPVADVLPLIQLWD